MSGPHPSGGTDPSMDDILASIRRILNEDDAAASPPAHPASSNEVFALDASMLVPEATPPASPHAGPVPPAAASATPEPPQPVPPQPAPPEPVPPPAKAAAPLPEPLPEPRMTSPDPAPVPPPAAPEPHAPPASEQAPASWPAPLVAPEAAAAAAHSVGSLRRTLEAGRSSVAVRTGGPTLDDIVREELRPILKAWLDANLPPIVERAVRAEIERVVGHADF